EPHTSREGNMGVEGCTKCIKYMLFFFNFIFWAMTERSDQHRIPALNLCSSPYSQCSSLAGCVILGVSLWLRHDQKTSSLLDLKYEDTSAPNTFYITGLVDAPQVWKFVAYYGFHCTHPSLQGLAIVCSADAIPDNDAGREDDLNGASLEGVVVCVVWFHISLTLDATGVSSSSRGGVYILIAVGAVMMFVGFLGCYGAIQESQCLLGTFFACLVILFACEVAAGIWGFINKDKLQCCGKGTLTAVFTGLVKNDVCPEGSSFLQTSCHTKINELFTDKIYLIGIAALVVAVIMIFEMIFSMVLCCGIRNSPVY
ncbi:hypothetical protein NFI96_028140, partial [Prochilodus magdalenae]